MDMSTRTQNQIMKAIRSSKGRYFGLYTKSGKAINAQFVSETASYINVYDRNSGSRTKLAKTSVTGIRLQGKKIGAAS